MTPFVHRETVRFNDCDPMGHLNNALFSTYLEQAAGRAVPAAAAADMRGGGTLRLAGPPAPRSGAQERAESEAERSGRSGALVGYDYEQARSIEIPERWKRRMNGD